MNLSFSGERIKFIREKILKLSQIDAAKLFNVNQASISNWEKGAREPNLDFLKDFTTKAGISLDWLIKGHGPMTPSRDSVTEAGATYTLGDSEMVQITNSDMKNVHIIDTGSQYSEHIRLLLVQIEQLKEIIKSKDKVISLLEKQLS